jgi:uncharacterized protein DUF3291
MKQPYGHPVVAGFEAITAAVFEEAERAPGFIDRAREIDDKTHLTNFERDWGAWGKFTVPRFYDGGYTTATDTRASTLSLWRSVEAVHAFARGGLHRRAVGQRQKWFRTPAWPSYAMWWVAEDCIPTWQQACQHLEYLHDNGPSPYAFNFSKHFDESGVARAVLTPSSALT